MAAPKIQLRRSSVSGKKPTNTQLQLGELAVNTYDGHLYIKQDTGGVGVDTSVILVNTWYSNSDDTIVSYDGTVNIGAALTVTGNVTANAFIGDGSQLTGVNAGLWASDGVGIHTTAKVGVGTETANSAYDLHVVGSGQTALFVQGGARVSGMLSVGENTITLDGQNNVIYVGDEVLISGDSINIGGDISIGSTASGINTCPNVLYVAKDGLDISNGTSIDTAKLTIAGALAIAESGDTIFVKSGTYTEANPLTVPAGVSIVGDSLREVTVTPQTATSDLFYVNKGTLLQGMTFTGHTAPAAAVAFPPGGATNVGGGKWESPYVRNCTSNTTTGTGMRIDGALAESLKSMVVDSYTQYNQGGVGIAITNEGYAQLVSAFTVCCDKAITAHKGGQCSLSNSNCDFGNFGLVADGVSDLQFSGTTDALAPAGTSVVTVDVGAATTRPYSGQVVYFGTLYNTVQEITITNGGSGYTSTPEVTFTAPTGPNGRTATARATVTNGSVTAITLISSGSQYEYGTATKYEHSQGTSSNSGEYEFLAGTFILLNKTDANGDAAAQPTPNSSIWVSNDNTNFVEQPITTVGDNGSAWTVNTSDLSPTTGLGGGDLYWSNSDPSILIPPTVTITAPDSGVTATATAELLPTYYTINSSTPISSGITTVTLDENLLNSVGSSATVNFYQQSKIVASSHTFEYVGSGIDITTATPKRGGVAIPGNEVVMTNGGKVVYTSTDQAGNFKIGDDLTINQNTGTISGRAFTQSLFAQMTPFILALSD